MLAPFPERAHEARGGVGSGEEGVLSVGYVALEMPLRRSSGDVQQAVGSMGLESRIEVCAGDVNVDVIHSYTGCMRLHSHKHR